MKRLWILAILMIVLAGCGRSTDRGGGQCKEGLCVKIEVTEPIRWGEPLLVQITVTSKEDISNLGVSLIYYGEEIVIEEPEKVEQGEVIWQGDDGLDWRVSIKAGQPVVLTRKLYFPAREGLIDLLASAITPQGLRVVHHASIDLHGGTGEVYYAGTPFPFTPWPLPVYTVTPGPSPTPRPTFTPFPTLPPPPTHSPFFRVTPTAYPLFSPPTSVPTAYP